ncbi:hypothetical protein BOTBODRAFT_189617 [Botryobasidium botryosum FD-172 SS1]|uniref:Uncharacterized protein n=1 Tax=Botryobasidium botryosum (strain FD-172 SS1) TaxID=930990 RepID=A0A067M7N7_BOTB1|nr:hypothetical protein BOTBODRAFT_189617 [Botryobasidium botryosum FD-172 SS1]
MSADSQAPASRAGTSSFGFGRTSMLPTSISLPRLSLSGHRSNNSRSVSNAPPPATPKPKPFAPSLSVNNTQPTPAPSHPSFRNRFSFGSRTVSTPRARSTFLPFQSCKSAQPGSPQAGDGAGFDDDSLVLAIERPSTSHHRPNQPPQSETTPSFKLSTRRSFSDRVHTSPTPRSPIGSPQPRTASVRIASSLLPYKSSTPGLLSLEIPSSNIELNVADTGKFIDFLVSNSHADLDIADSPRSHLSPPLRDPAQQPDSTPKIASSINPSTFSLSSLASSNSVTPERPTLNRREHFVLSGQPSLVSERFPGDLFRSSQEALRVPSILSPAPDALPSATSATPLVTTPVIPQTALPVPPSSLRRASSQVTPQKPGRSLDPPAQTVGLEVEVAIPLETETQAAPVPNDMDTSAPVEIPQVVVIESTMCMSSRSSTPTPTVVDDHSVSIDIDAVDAMLDREFDDEWVAEMMEDDDVEEGGQVLDVDDVFTEADDGTPRNMPPKDLGRYDSMILDPTALDPDLAALLSPHNLKSRVQPSAPSTPGPRELKLDAAMELLDVHVIASTPARPVSQRLSPSSIHMDPSAFPSSPLIPPISRSNRNSVTSLASKLGMGPGLFTASPLLRADLPSDGRSRSPSPTPSSSNFRPNRHPRSVSPLNLAADAKPSQYTNGDHPRERSEGAASSGSDIAYSSQTDPDQHSPLTTTSSNYTPDSPLPSVDEEKSLSMDSPKKGQTGSSGQSSRSASVASASLGAKTAWGRPPLPPHSNSTPIAENTRRARPAHNEESPTAWHGLEARAHTSVGYNRPHHPHQSVDSLLADRDAGALTEGRPASAAAAFLTHRVNGHMKKYSGSSDGGGIVDPYKPRPPGKPISPDWLGPRTARVFAAAGLLETDENESEIGSHKSGSNGGGGGGSSPYAAWREREVQSSMSTHHSHPRTHSRLNSDPFQSHSKGGYPRPPMSVSDGNADGGNALNHPTSPVSSSRTLFSSSSSSAQATIQVLKERHEMETETLLNALVESRRVNRELLDDNAQLSAQVKELMAIITDLEIKLAASTGSSRREPHPARRPSIVKRESVIESDYQQYARSSSSLSRMTPLNWQPGTQTRPTERRGSSASNNMRAQAGSAMSYSSTRHTALAPIPPLPPPPTSLEPDASMLLGGTRKNRDYRTSSISSVVFSHLNPSMTMLLHEKGLDFAESGVSGDESRSYVSRSPPGSPQKDKRAAMPKTVMTPRPIVLPRATGFPVAEPVDVSPTEASFAFTTTSSSPGSLKLRREDEMHLNDLISMRCGFDDEEYYDDD